MATYYWVGGSGDFYDLTLSHWSTSSGGSPSGVNPSSSDDVVFDGNSGVGTCTFTSVRSCNSFTVNNTFMAFNTTGGAAELQVGGNLSLAAGNVSNMQSLFENANFSLRLNASVTGSYTVTTSTLNITRVYIEPASSSTNYYLSSFNSSGTPGYVAIKRLDHTSGNVYLGYNYTYSYRFGDVSNSSQHTALYCYSTNNKSINTSSSNPAVTITAYGDVTFGTQYNGNYTVNLDSSTILDFRGSATPRVLTVTPAGSSPSSTYVPFGQIQNYTGENISGSSVGSGVQLQLTGAPISVHKLTCKSAGSVSGSYSRGVVFDGTYKTKFFSTYAAPLDAVGDSTNQVVLTAPMGQFSDIEAVNGASPGTLQVYYCTLSRMTADMTGTYLAYTSNGNVDGGFNSDWVFTAPSSGGFLLFFQ